MPFKSIKNFWVPSRNHFNNAGQSKIDERDWQGQKNIIKPVLQRKKAQRISVFRIENCFHGQQITQIALRLN